MASCINQKNGCNWEDLPKDLLSYSTVYWHYKQWRQVGVLEELMRVLHGQVRQQVKKAQMDDINHY
jgi:transposase